MKKTLSVLINCAFTIQLLHGALFSVKNVIQLEEGSDFRVLKLDVQDPPGVFFGGNGTIIYYSFDNNNRSEEEIGVCYDSSGFSCHNGARPTTEDCYNYIRHVTSLGRPCDHNDCTKLYFCGTNALNPSCFFCGLYSNGSLQCSFERNEDDISDQECENENPNFDGRYTFPRTRNENATVLYIDDTSQFYFGARESRTNGKSLIGHRGVNAASGVINAAVVRTRSDSDKAVNDANFVGTPFSRGDYVYYLYRETSEEYASVSTGQDVSVQNVFSRIARVCESDAGYSAGADTVWSSFLKQRLVCKKAGDDEFDVTIYDEIQDFIYDENEIIYAIFTTSRYEPAMSALCTFNLTEIDEVFNTGTFYGSDGSSANDLWRDYSGTVVSPRPGENCNNPNTAQTFFQRDYPNLKPDATEEAKVTRNKDRFSKLAVFRKSQLTLLIGSENGCLYQYEVEANEIKPECPPALSQKAITGLSVASDAGKDTYDVFMTTVDGIYAAQINGDVRSSPDDDVITHTNTVTELIYQGDGDDIIFSLTNTTVQILKNETLDETDPVILRYQVLILEDAAVHFGDSVLNITLGNTSITDIERAERDSELEQEQDANRGVGSSCMVGQEGFFNVTVISSVQAFQYCSDCLYYKDNSTRDCSDLC